MIAEESATISSCILRFDKTVLDPSCHLATLLVVGYGPISQKRLGLFNGSWRMMSSLKKAYEPSRLWGMDF